MDKNIRRFQIIRFLENERLTNEGLINKFLQDLNEPVIERTLQRDFNYLRDNFEIDFIDHLGENPGKSIDRSGQTDRGLELERLTNQLAITKIFQEIGMGENVMAYLSVSNENVNNGFQYLKSIANAINNKKRIKLLRHENYALGQNSSWILEPYLLKETGGTWYVYGYRIKPENVHRNAPAEKEKRIFGLDRVDGIQLLDEEFQVDPNFRPKEDYEDRIGVSGSAVTEVESIQDPDEPQAITLKLYDRIAHIVNKVPLHKTQRTIQALEKVDDRTVIEISLFVMINFELLKFIKANAGDVKIVQPTILKDRVKRELEGGANFL